MQFDAFDGCLVVNVKSLIYVHIHFRCFNVYYTVSQKSSHLLAVCNFVEH